MNFTTLDVKIVAGKDNGSNVITLQPEDVVKVVSFPVGVKPTVGVDMKITTGRNEDIHPAVPYQEFESRGGGSHFDCAKDLFMKGNREIKIFLTAQSVINDDFTIRTLFYHKTPTI